MKHITTPLLLVLFCYSNINAQIFDYDQSSRRVLVDGNDFGDTSTTIINDFGYWNFNDFISSRPGTYQGSMQISNLGTDGICSKSYTWNSIVGSHPSGGDAQSSIITSFTLDADRRFKIDFFGAIHADTYQGYLFIPPQFFLKSGLSGNNGTLLNIVGSGIQTIDLSAGDYQITTAVGSSYSCINDPNCVAFVSGQTLLSLSHLTNSGTPGSSFDAPFLPDSYSETQSPDHMSYTPEGAVILRGENSTLSYIDATDGWFDIGGESQSIIDMQSDGIITTLQLPENRLGIFQVSVADIVIGDFSSNAIINFSDYSQQLGVHLVSGLNNSQGIKSIEINYQEDVNENLTNLCGLTENSAIKLTFDESLVSFNVVMPFTPVPDEIFINGFE